MTIKVKSTILALINLIAGLIFLSINNNLKILGPVENVILISFIILSFFGIVLCVYNFVKDSINSNSSENNEESIVLSSWYSTKVIIDIILITTFLIRFFLIQPFIVIGNSMEPSFQEGNYLLIDKISYRLGEPKRGEVIVFRYPDDPNKIFIKRIIALPNETVEIKEGDVTIYNNKNTDGVKLSESYTESGVEILGNISRTLDDEEYFVLGDNRQPNQSKDSREGWNVKKSEIIGKVWTRAWPIAQWKILQTPQYNFSENG